MLMLAIMALTMEQVHIAAILDQGRPVSPLMSCCVAFFWGLPQVASATFFGLGFFIFEGGPQFQHARRDDAFAMPQQLPWLHAPSLFLFGQLGLWRCKLGPNISCFLETMTDLDPPHGEARLGGVGLDENETLPTILGQRCQRHFDDVGGRRQLEQRCNGFGRDRVLGKTEDSAWTR